MRFLYAPVGFCVRLQPVSKLIVLARTSNAQNFLLLRAPGMPVQQLQNAHFFRIKSVQMRQLLGIIVLRKMNLTMVINPKFTRKLQYHP